MTAFMLRLVLATGPLLLTMGLAPDAATPASVQTPVTAQLPASAAATVAPHPQPPAAAPSTAAVPAPTTKIAAGGILGRDVVGPDGNTIGRVVDVLVDAGSNPRAVVINFGGFMGVGSRQVAVNWSDLIFPAVTNAGTPSSIRLDLTADQIKSAPSYTDQTKPASVVVPPPAKSPLTKPEAAAGH